MAAVGAFLVAGCASSDPAPTPAACLDERAITTALARAPDRVRLPDGSPLSRCVRLAAHRDGDLQALGATLTRIADGLRGAAGSDPQATGRLGYLVGAARRGAARTPGLAAQLARRLGLTASFDDALTRDAVLRGVASGEETG